MRCLFTIGLALGVFFAPSYASAASTSLLISEFRTRGPNGVNDEFIEIFNVSGVPVDLGGFSLMASNSSGVTTLLKEIPANTVIAARHHYLVVNGGTQGYSGIIEPDAAYAMDIPDDGAIALLNGSGGLVDAAGMSSQSAYVEGAALAPLVGNVDQSYERNDGGCAATVDTDDNASNFRLNALSSGPQNTSVDCSVCVGISCTKPPADFCSDPNTLVAYPSIGTCSTLDGCSYPSTSQNCPFGCDASLRQCSPSRCTASTCSSAPNDCYEASGTCISGACAYQPRAAQTPCSDENPCTKGDACDGSGKCVGTKVPVDDSNVCTVDVCDATTGKVTHANVAEGTECDDGDPCTLSDACSASGVCAGYAKPCYTPPPSTCDKGITHGFNAAGTCDEGTCKYAPVDSECAAGCSAAFGGCNEDPCLGVNCTNPPGPCFLETGTCKDGECDYAPSPETENCDDGDECTEDDACNGKGTCAGSKSTRCEPDASTDAPGSGGATGVSDGGASGTQQEHDGGAEPPDTADAASVTGGGASGGECGCNVPRSPNGVGWPLGVGALSMLAAIRRRRQSSGAPQPARASSDAIT